MTTVQNAIRARVAPIPEEFLQRVRSGFDDLQQNVKRLVASGGEPCRDVLRRARQGEELILASFSPFRRPGPFHEYGPVYVLASASNEAVERAVIPCGGDADYLRAQFVIRAYSVDEEILDAALVSPDSAQDAVERFFPREDVAFLHVRFPTYGCFAARLDR